MSAEKKIVVIEGDDASPEAMRPTVDLLKSLQLPIEWQYPEIGEASQARGQGIFPAAAKALIDASDTTFFGSTSGSSGAALLYLRWGRSTYANVRPCHFLPGFKSPLANPEGMDFVIVRENLEDLYVGIEGDLEELAHLNLTSRTARKGIGEFGPGKFAIKAITEAGTERVVRFGFELAKKRAAAGVGKSKVTVTSKYNMLGVSDGYFREVAGEVAKKYPDIEYNTYIVDDFCCRMIADPHQFDVVVMPNLYGDILSDGAAGMMGGMGLAASGCYGDDYAYFESAHGTAPDIVGQNIINPTACLRSAVLMLDYLGFGVHGRQLERAIARVYANGKVLTRDQGGSASTQEFCHAIGQALAG